MLERSRFAVQTSGRRPLDAKLTLAGLVESRKPDSARQKYQLTVNFVRQMALHCGFASLGPNPDHFRHHTLSGSQVATSTA